jgi:hypothetical protein
MDNHTLKIRRPLTVWLSQALLLIVLVAIAIAIGADIYEYGLLPAGPFEVSTDPMDGLSNILEGLFTIAFIAGFFGMAFRARWSRLLTAGTFFVFFLWFVVIFLTDAELWADIQADEPIYQYMFISLLILFFVPFPLLGLALAFGRKARLFFAGREALFSDAPPLPHEAGVDRDGISGPL